MKPPTKIQEWRPIEGFPGYEVSNWGRVRRWYDMTERRAEERARIGGPLRVDSFGTGDVFHINLQIHPQNKTVGLERVKGSKKYVHCTVASLQLAAFPESEALKAA